MKNPWTKKNPFMSMWLSGANSIAGAARGHAHAEAKRQATAFTNEAAKQVADFWTALPCAFIPLRSAPDKCFVWRPPCSRAGDCDRFLASSPEARRAAPGVQGRQQQALMRHHPVVHERPVEKRLRQPFPTGQGAITGRLPTAFSRS